MNYADRAKALKERRGDTPLFIGEATASSTTIINHLSSAWSTAVNAILFIVLGAAICAAVGILAGYDHRLNPAEIRLIEQARQRGMDLDSMSSIEIEARLSLPPDAISTTISVLQVPETVPPDMRWVSQIEGQPNSTPSLPSRVEALRAVDAFIASAPPAERGHLLDGLRVDAALTERARSILEPLRQTRPSDGVEIGHVLSMMLALPPDQLGTLISAGFPPVPHDQSRQAIYQKLSTLDDRAAAFVWQFVSGSAGHQQTAIAVSTALQAPAISRALGALRDGDRATTIAIDALPRTCTADIPRSCLLTSR